MMLETNAELLGRVPIFEGLTPARLDRIVRSSREVYFEPGQALITAGESGRSAFLILGGAAMAAPYGWGQDAGELLGYGTLLGEMAMLAETIFTITVIARRQVRALALDRSVLYALMEEDPAIARHFAGKLVGRLRRLADDLRQVDGRFAAIEVSLEQSLA